MSDLPDNINLIAPQPGFQEKVLSSPADVLIMGGSAGCGKTMCLLMEPLRYVGNEKFAGIILRREYVQIKLPGGLWDKSVELYSQLSGENRPQMKFGNLEHSWSSGAKVAFDHIQQEQSVYRYQGPEFAYIGFDELTHFTAKQFFYLLTRSRSTSGIDPLVRASTNPQGEGWVKDLVQWYIYPDDYIDETKRGFPIPERSGVLRYFVQLGNEIKTIVWGLDRLEVWNQLDEGKRRRLANMTAAQWAKLTPEKQFEVGQMAIRSFSFIFGLLADNPILTTQTPGYVGSLLAQDEETQAQLLDGRWSNMGDDAQRLYLDASIADLFTNKFVRRTGIRYITADVALEGSDRMVVIVWDGWVIIDIKIYHKTDGARVFSILTETAKRWSVPGRNIAFDADGAGGFLKGFLKNSFSFVGGSRPMTDSRKIKDGRPRPNYDNLRAQVYFYFRDMLDDCTAYCAVDDGVLQTEIRDELKAIKKMERAQNGKLAIIPKIQIKAILKRSPDIADAIVMRSVFELKKAPERKPRKLRAIGN